MKKSIISLLVAICLIYSGSISAGKTKGKVTALGPKSPMISFSLNGNGGINLSEGISKATSFNPNLGIEVVWMNLGFGIDASTFTTMLNFDVDKYTGPLNNLDFLKISNLSNSWRSTSILFGPSYTIPLGLSNPIPGIGIVVKHNPPATLTLSVKGGISINQTPDFSIVDNSTPQRSIAINNADAYKKNVLTFKPSIVFAYWFSENFAVNVNASYTTQVGQGEFTTKYRDLSKVDFTSTKVDLIKQQISSAPVLIINSKGIEELLSFGVGLTYRFGSDWDGSVKGGKAQRKGWDGSVKVINKGIRENGLEKNDAEYSAFEADVKTIAETLVNLRKGWDGSVKGIAEKKAIKENGLKKNDAENSLADTEVKAIAETLVNLRKGWDGSVKGINKAGIKINEAKSETTGLTTQSAETLVDLARKSWDGSIKGGKVEYTTKATDIESVTEVLLNIRKGWDGSIKGGNKASKVLKTKHDTVKNSINNIR